MENPMDRGAWWAAVYGAPQNWGHGVREGGRGYWDNMGGLEHSTPTPSISPYPFTPQLRSPCSPSICLRALPLGGDNGGSPGTPANHSEVVCMLGHFSHV